MPKKHKNPLETPKENAAVADALARRRLKEEELSQLNDEVREAKRVRQAAEQKLMASAASFKAKRSDRWWKNDYVDFYVTRWTAASVWAIVCQFDEELRFSRKTGESLKISRLYNYHASTVEIDLAIKKAQGRTGESDG